jgi:hypothetical protein
VDIMTDMWPVAELDAVRRLTVLAAAIPGARVASRIVAAPFDEVWAVMSDLEGEFGRFQPDLRRVRITRRDGERLEAVARSRWGMRARFDVLLRPGWCWMQSRFLLIGMAARPDPAGTLVALTGGIRVPGRTALVPVLVGLANRRAANRLAARVTARRV